MIDIEGSLSNYVTDKMKVNLNVGLDWDLVVWLPSCHIRLGESEMEKLSLRKSAMSHNIYEVAFVSTLYSASVNDLATTLYFFELQDMRLGLRKLMYFEVNFLSTKFSTYSTLKYVVRVEFEILWIWILLKMVCLKYRGNLFAIAQSVVVGLCINWDNLFTAKEISRCVSGRYCKAPMILLNYVLSTEDVPSISLREVLVDSRLVTSFVPCMLVFVNKSLIYLCCDKKRHFVVASMPKKKCSWPMFF